MGIANVHYLRYQRRFLLLATHGFHPFYDDEAQSIRDARRIPIKFEGYSISVAKGGFLAKAREAGRCGPRQSNGGSGSRSSGNCTRA